jgi:hypothetical protein
LESTGKADSGAPGPEIPHGISHKLTRTARPPRGPSPSPFTHDPPAILATRASPTGTKRTAWG